jgi:hypothetical protein
LREDTEMPNIIASIGLYGDPHLCDRDYGAHNNYPEESIYYYSEITKIVEKRKLTHLIGTGDFTFGRFKVLEYREKVEKELQKQFDLTNGNHYELCGNHDIAGYGMCERDFYINKGLLKKSENLTLGNLHITMVDYGKYNEIVPNIVDSENSINVVVAHDFFKFRNTNIANFGKAVELDLFDRWYGTDLLICGHIHKILNFSGYIQKGNLAHELQVNYLGCMSRPAYREGNMDDVGQVMILTIYDDGHMDLDIETIKLWSLEKSFNFEEKVKEQTKKEEKANRVDITDIVKQLDSHDRNVGNPEDIINAMKDIDEKYKNKAISLLKEALA